VLVVSEDLEELFELKHRADGDGAGPAVPADRDRRRDDLADRASG